MMDLKEIIKWFIPCFHILLMILNKKDVRLTFICLFLLFNFRVACAANVKLEKSGVEIIDTKNVSFYYDNKLKVNQSDVFGAEMQLRESPQFADASVGRTFGRPFKKMMGALLPLIFQIGAASTWAVVAALVGVKTLAVTLIILKILLIAGAAKTLALADSHKAARDRRAQSMASQWPRQWYRLYQHVLINGTKDTSPDSWVQMQQVGALFGSKTHSHGGWEPHHPQKEIHLHIHNGHQDSGHDEHVPVYGAWSRDDGSNAIETKHTAIDPYSIVGPQTIRTPFGNYVKVDLNNPLTNTG